ncbi:MAG: UbiD family decarboxylase domain-containing protein [Candidatus Binataceae bacterium]
METPASPANRTINGLQPGSIAHAAKTGPKIGCLRDFLALLAENRQLITWHEPTMPEPGIRNISVAASNDVSFGPAVLFDNIRGYEGRRVVVGVHGSWANIALLLGHPKGATIKEMFFDMTSRWGAKGGKAELNWVKPEDARIHEVRIEKAINLYDLIPLYRINEFDGGFYLAKAAVVSRDPRDPEDFNRQNVGIYRLQVQGPDRFSLMTIPTHDIGRQIMMAEADKRPFRIAVMLGNHPAIAMFAATPLGYEESEFSYAAAMMGQPLELTQSGNGMDILAGTEIVLEAELRLGERVIEGPFGEFPGSYSGVRRAPVFKVTAVSHRRDPHLREHLYWQRMDRARHAYRA